MALEDLDVSLANPDKKMQILKYAVEVRRAEIDRLWTRSTLFWAFIGAAFVAYGTAYDKGCGLPGAIICCFGLICSFAWTLQNRGSKYWQEAWENKVERVESYVLSARLFENKEPLQKHKGPFGAKRYSVSRLVIALSDFTIAVWSVLLAFTICNLRDPTFQAISLILVAASVAYAGFIMIWCRSSE